MDGRQGSSHAEIYACVLLEKAISRTALFVRDLGRESVNGCPFEVRSSPAIPKSLMIGFRLEINSGVAFRVRETHCPYDHAVRAQDEGGRSQSAWYLSF